ncbi:MAG TPA: hypothetical protein VGL02_23430 [Streptomyces sp.]
MNTDAKLDQRAHDLKVHVGETARHLGQRVRGPMHKLSDRALRRLSGLHEQLHDAAKEQRRGKGGKS